MLTVVLQEVVGLRSIRQRLGSLRGLNYRGSLDVVHLHYSLPVQFPNCFPLPASRRDRHGAVGREPSNSTGGTLTRVRASCAGCCAGTIQFEKRRTVWRAWVYAKTSNSEASTGGEPNGAPAN